VNKYNKDRVTALSALIPFIASIKIMPASLVPKPKKVIGIVSINTVIETTMSKNVSDRFMPSDCAIR